MAAYFFDSSALVKRYGSEIGTAWVISLFKPSAANRIYVARITSVETISALSGHMYDYRKLTQEMREEVVALWKARGLPWHSRPHGKMGYSIRRGVKSSAFCSSRLRTSVNISA